MPRRSLPGGLVGLLAACTLTAATPAAAQARGETPSLVTYRCDGDRRIVVGYPAYRDAATAPIRLAWQGTTVLLEPARSGSGARYVSRRFDLQWWSKGRGAFLERLSDGAPLARDCVES